MANQWFKRFRPRARGRSGKILKPFSKVKILVQEKEKEKKKNIEKKNNSLEEKKWDKKLTLLALDLALLNLGNRDGFWKRLLKTFTRRYHYQKIPHKKTLVAGISKVVIERPAKLAKITIHTSRPGVIIGKKGSDIEKLKKDIGNITEVMWV